MFFMMKTEINHLFDLLTCQFLKVIFPTCPPKASPIPILIFRKPLPPISSFTESFKIFSTLRKFCQFSYPDPAPRGHLQPCHLPCTTLTLDTMTPDTRFAPLPTTHARLPTAHSRLPILHSRLPILHSRLPRFPSPGPRAGPELSIKLSSSSR